MCGVALNFQNPPTTSHTQGKSAGFTGGISVNRITHYAKALVVVNSICVV